MTQCEQGRDLLAPLTLLAPLRVITWCVLLIVDNRLVFASVHALLAHAWFGNAQSLLPLSGRPARSVCCPRDSDPSMADLLAFQRPIDHQLGSAAQQAGTARMFLSGTSRICERARREGATQIPPAFEWGAQDLEAKEVSASCSLHASTHRAC